MSKQPFFSRWRIWITRLCQCRGKIVQDSGVRVYQLD